MGNGYWLFDWGTSSTTSTPNTTAASSHIKDTKLGGQIEGKEEVVIVLGAGNFGTCLADHLADLLGTDVTIWARDKNVVDSINLEHENKKYMAGVKLSSKLKATTELTPELIKSATVIIMAIPTQHMRSVATTIRPYLTVNHLLLFANKGIEITSGLLPNQISLEVFGDDIGSKVAFLSGPSFAIEVVKRQPTCVAVASKSRARAHRAQRLFHAPHFRVYDSVDTVGVEIAGALKNVIAIASGACTGLGFQQNARAALITRGLAEIARIGVAMGADPLTFTGLAGAGDLFLTATSEKSRNFTVGKRIGEGEALDHVLATLGSVAEGVETTRAAYTLCRKLNVDSPLVNSVHKVLFEGGNIKMVLAELMGRDPKTELTGIRD
ncbi:6-phosphogluconate dehydrogenase [Polychytrium aggregatum]|uniref:6-phosphogluconate dehydrogenase n=1 Tax=Polychytrium aggregatum TaxID=110093 RepID=UPI0022FE30FB|nr:6-phosphogluconate dehydrogenase [Polychytrium aggregatum]KAI9193108.1 6-phosphogluconate dehydrogenase [Polychytrium aggregatum]